MVVEHRRAAGAGGGVDGPGCAGDAASGRLRLRCYTPGLRHEVQRARASHADETPLSRLRRRAPARLVARGVTVSLPCLLLPSTPAGATPAMRQFFEAKRQYRDAILFFRMGDFYEMFYEDALTAARALELTLTSRAKDASGGAIPMCGVPYHAADAYIARLVRKGFRVAICEQMEDPKKAKGLVRREVVRVVSPGTLTDAGYLDAREPAFLMALAPGPPRPGLRRRAARSLDRRVHDRRVRRTRCAAGAARRAGGAAAARDRRAVGFRRRGSDGRDPAAGGVGHHGRAVDVRQRSGAACAARPAADAEPRSASGSKATPPRSAPPARSSSTCATRRRSISRTSARSPTATGADCLIVDPTTLRNLEVIEAADGGRAGSLLHEIDRTVTSMGGRLLRTWLLRRCSRSSASRIGSTPSRSSPSAAPSARSCRTRCKHRPRHRAAGRARGARHRRPARSGRAAAVARRGAARAAAASASCTRRSSAAWPPSSTISPICAQQLEATLRRRAAGAGARRRRDSRRRRSPSSTSCATSAAPASGASPRWRRRSAPGPASAR